MFSLNVKILQVHTYQGMESILGALQKQRLCSEQPWVGRDTLEEPSCLGPSLYPSPTSCLFLSLTWTYLSQSPQ